MPALEDLALCSIFNTQDPPALQTVNSFVGQLAKIPKIKSLDLSKNKLMPDTFSVLFGSGRLNNLQALSISQTNLLDRSVLSFCSYLQQAKTLRVLNLSGNTMLSTDSLRKILQAMKGNSFELQELNLSKLSFANDELCYNELANFLFASKQLRQLTLQRVSLTDATAFCLIDAMAKAPKLQTIKLDWNKLTGVFVERYCKKVGQMGYTPTAQNVLNLDTDQSILQSDSDSQVSRLGSARQTSPN